MSLQQPLVDGNGDLIIHGRQGVELTLEFQNADGSLRDMTGKSVTWECGTDINKPLAIVAGTPSQMTLTITNADVKTIYNAINKDFVLLDNSGAQPTPVWAGSVNVIGWVE